MPEVSRFYGIVITFNFDDHLPPHFHARYGEFAMSLTIDGLLVMKGSLPKRAFRLVRDWAEEHRAELRSNWRRARRGVPLVPIPPLD